MSRGEFRAALSTPRPRAAIGLVAIANASLAVTGQIEPWALTLEALALGASLLTREQPRPWQRSVALLNLGLAAIVGCCFALALRGEPALISLAHFAFLAQGLQLVDARPRRSEFLLVALALFQVVLASNLTDSLLFSPLLLLFLPTAVWTLLVHTLRTEALEAGDPPAATRAITPGLLATTLLASGLSIALALVLFLLLPRLHSGFVRGPLATAGGAAAGFSDEIALGELGRIRSDPTVVLRVETLRGRAPAPEDAYWRGLAFDAFDGRRWSVSPARGRRLIGDAELGVRLSRAAAPLEQRVVREPVESGVLFGLGEGLRLEGSVGLVERDANGGLYAPASEHERVRYQIGTHPGRRSEPELRADRALPPPGGERYLELPPLSDAVYELAFEVAGAAGSDAERASVLEAFLRSEGRYSDTPPEIDPDELRSPVEQFLLGERSGHCEYFASALVVLARALGMPARMVNGFAGGRENRIGGFVELRRSDAHAWVEIHYARAGWVRYDPTPPDLRASSADELGLGGRLEELRSALELWWFQRVVNFDRSTQLRGLRALWEAWRGISRPRDPTPGAATPAARPWGGIAPSRSLPALLAAAALAGCGLLLARRRRARGRGAALPPAYAAALRLLARRGLVRQPTATARDFARRARVKLPPAAAAAFSRLTESYLAQRFGARPWSEPHAELRALRDSLRG